MYSERTILVPERYCFKNRLAVSLPTCSRETIARYMRSLIKKTR